MKALAVILATSLLISCGPKKPLPGPDLDVAATLEMARARPIPERAQSRFNIRVRSRPLEISGSTGGGLVVDRPGRMHLEVFGPLGATLAKVTSDGTALGVMMPRDKQHLVADSAEDALREVSGGALGLDDLVGLLLGDLPFDAAELVGTTTLEDGEHELQLRSDTGIEVWVHLDPSLGTPSWLEARAEEGTTMVEATYGAFEESDGFLWPSEVEVFLPSVELTVGLKYRGFALIEQPPDIFEVATPEDYTRLDLEESLKRLAQPSP